MPLRYVLIDAHEFDDGGLAYTEELLKGGKKVLLTNTSSTNIGKVVKLAERIRAGTIWNIGYTRCRLSPSVATG